MNPDVLLSPVGYTLCKGKQILWAELKLRKGKKTYLSEIEDKSVCVFVCVSMTKREESESKLDFFLLLYRIVCTRSPFSQTSASQSVHSKNCSSPLKA